MSINKNIQEHINCDHLDGEDNILDLQKSLSEDFSLTEENLLDFISRKEKYFSLIDFRKWLRWSLDIQDDDNKDYKKWKNFLIQHGYINEKEEIIYKPLEETNI